MPALTRVSDADVTHCSQPKRKEGSPDVICNGLAVSRQGDHNTVHNRPGSPCPPHTAPITTGSLTVFANGKGVGRVGDAVTACTSVQQGSPDVFAG